MKFSIRAAQLCVLLSFGLTTGCMFNPNKEFTRYDADRFGADRVLLVADVLMMDDVQGPEHVVNLEVNDEVRAEILASLRKRLAAKGYRVEEAAVESVGLAADASMRFHIVESGSRKDGSTAWEDGEGLVPGGPSHEIAHGPLLHPDLASILATAHQRVMSTPLDQLDDVGDLGMRQVDFSGFSGVILLHAVGVKVPFGKSFGQAMLSGIATLGTVAMWQQSNTVIGLALIDANSHELVWANRTIIASSVRETEDLERQLDLLIDALPERSVEARQSAP